MGEKREVQSSMFRRVQNTISTLSSSPGDPHTPDSIHRYSRVSVVFTFATRVHSFALEACVNAVRLLYKLI